MLNVLVNAYAVSPLWGSEPGMGWNWIANISKYCNLFIITEEEWQEKINTVLDEQPFKDNLHFFYIPISENARSMFHNQGDWRFYWHYKQWQKAALEKAKEICRDTEIDVVHQLNTVTFREPGYLWQLDKPFVWGPIGGLGETTNAYFKDAPLKTRMLLSVKDYISLSQFRFSHRINEAFLHSQVLISAVPFVQEAIKTIKKRDSFLIPETGCYDLNTSIIDKRQRNEFHIIWTGRFIYTKRLDIALRSIAMIKDLPNLHFHIVGIGSDEQVQAYKNLGHKLGIDSICEWHGKVENRKVHEMMREADLFFFTSIREATSTVIPEAINNCLPIVCFNACGFGPLVTEKIGRKVELTTPEQSAIDFAKEIRKLYYDKELLYEMSLNCREALKELLWEEKAKRVVTLYEEAIEIFNRNHAF